MSDVKISEARDQLAELADRAHYEHARFTLTKGGRPWAVLISAEDAELLRALEDALDRRMAEEALAEGSELIAWERVKSDLGL